MLTTDTTGLSAAERNTARSWVLTLIAAGAGGAALLLRLALHTRSFDLFGDEVIYTDLGRSVFAGGFPRFGGPFFLHGPCFFYLEAGWERLLGSPAGVLAQVGQMRALNALLAGITAVVLVLLGARASSPRAGAAAGLIFALDPFCIRQNDRVLLETALMLWVLTGYLFFASLPGRPGRWDWLRAGGAGLMFGLAALTKDEAVLLTVLPLLGLAALGWGPRRILTLIAIGVTFTVYAAYVGLVAVCGYFSAFWQAKTLGLRRLLGVVQTTGFHSSGGGSLTARLVAEGPAFSPTYLILALAVPAVLLVLRRGGPLPRILALLYGAAAVTLGYAVVLGTLEEQELYLLAIPSLLIIPVAVTLLRDQAGARSGYRGEGRRRPPRAVLLTVALAMLTSLNLITCGQWLRQPDDGFARLTQFMSAGVPAGSRVGIIDDDFESPYVLGGRYDVGLWDTPAAIARNRVRYLVVEWALVDEGYSSLTAADVRRLVVHAQPVFSFRGRTYGDLQLFRMPPSGGRPPARPLTDGAAPPIAPVAAVPGRQ